MTANPKSRVALLWRGDQSLRADVQARTPRLVPIFDALAREGIAPEPAVYYEAAAADVRAQLSAVNAVLVWVDPISDGRDRRQLDPLLRDVAANGVWVSSHPDIILKMGVKEVLFRTRDLGWGTDTHLYATRDELRADFPKRLLAAPRVLKQNRGNGGDGVWKIEQTGPGDQVEVLHARRGSQVEAIPLDALLDRMDGYFEGGGKIIDQPFQARLSEGMIRCYLVQDRVVGFGRQLIKALLPPDAGEPGPRLMSDADWPPFQKLRSQIESEWVPAMMRRLHIAREDLPVIWDADFLYGPKTPAGEDTYVLCEINVSSVLPIPDEAPAAIARCVASRLVTRSVRA
jgi:hypothetical protein